jgi:hypothetical protein
VIYYWPGLDHTPPSGGVRTHYDHVEHLNALGYEASILHLKPGFTPGWFTSPAPVVYAPTTELSVSDYLVVNEIMGPETANIAPGIPKVIFCQNIHYTWRNWPIPPQSPPPYTHPDIKAALVLTEYERDMLTWAFPRLPVYVTPHGYDFTKFYPAEKKRQIAFMPRKHADEAQQVFGWLGALDKFRDWSVVAIDGMTEDQTAQVMRESLIFAQFGYPEGGTRPPFEAMAAGCFVVGYGGFASDQDMDACGAEVIPSGDSCEFAQALAYYMTLDTKELTEMGMESRKAVMDTFSKANERAAIQRAWTSIRSRAS